VYSLLASFERATGLIEYITLEPTTTTLSGLRQIFCCPCVDRTGLVKQPLNLNVYIPVETVNVYGLKYDS